MIDKVKTCKRIIALRKELGYAQGEFADKLNVTPQAVSKWETGLALPDIEILQVMSGLFKISVNEILEGKNIIPRLANRQFEMDDGIAYFMPKEDADGSLDWANEIINGNWVKRNWDERKKHNNANPHLENIAHKINEHGGIILELGAGPGGGMMPSVLFEKHDADVIISDISPTIVRERKKLFDYEFFPPNMSYAVLDSCALPFLDNSIDVVSIGGFNNTNGDKYKAIREIYRVLKPGGLYVATDGCVTKAKLESYPAGAQRVMLEKIPFIFEDYYEATMAAGFRQIDNMIMSELSTKGDQSLINDVAEELGIDLIVTWYARFCVKQ